MFWERMSAHEASEWAGRLWELLTVVWVVLWFGMKPVKKREEWIERIPHLVLVVLGFWLLFGSAGLSGWLNHRVLPDQALLWETGLTLTALGVGIAIWARLSLGSNWSGTVTLKNDHELIRKGLYR
jgi:protein-S-isoprenylcysteine O-methyltransferase